MPGTPNTFKRPSKPTQRYEEMQRAVQEQRLRLELHPPARGKNALLKAQLLAAEPEILPPPLPSNVTKTGYYGVVRASASDHGHRNRKPYQARIPVGKASWVHLGSYDTAEEAGRHAAAAHNALLKGPLPPPVEKPRPPRLRRRTNSSHHESVKKWTEDEDNRLIQILVSPKFDVPLDRRGGIACGSTKTGVGDEAYWRRVAEEMGYENSEKAARRCSRRWWYLNPKNADRLEAKRSYERKRKKEQAQSRVGKQKCLADALDGVVFEADDDPFESALAADDDASLPVEQAQDVIVRLESALAVASEPVETTENVVLHLSQFKEPIDSLNKEVDFYSYEVLSDITAERGSCSDLSELSLFDDFNHQRDVYEFYSSGGFSTRVVKRTRTPSTKAQHITFTFQRSNLGRVAFKQVAQRRNKMSKHRYQKRYRELKKREAFDAVWRATNYNASLRAHDAAWHAARDVLTTRHMPPTPVPSLPAPEPPLQDASLSLVQERMETYLKACKPTLATEEVDWALAKAPAVPAVWEVPPLFPSYTTAWSAVGAQLAVETAA